jgi:Putative beta-barrel porin-2, OmpL-like. bbp2
MSVDIWQPALLALLVFGTTTTARAQDRPLPIGPGQGEEIGALTGEDEGLVQVTGFAVGEFNYAGRTHDNSFAASKIAVALFRELSDNVWFFGQLTTAIDEEADASEEGEVATPTEIDNLLVNVTPPGLSSVSVSIGKFDVPIGFERDDEPLNLQPSSSFNYTLARPVKMVGMVGRWNASPSVDLALMVSNGWDADLAPHHGKTGGLRLGLKPSSGVSVGVSGLYGPEGEPDESHNRYLLTFDYTFQPTPDWIIAGEGNYGGDRAVDPGETDVNWAGGTFTIFRRLGRRLGITARADAFRDIDGSRTGEVQTLTSYTFAPVYFLGVGREGIFANIEHTTFRIPRFQIRGEVRIDHSSIPFFEIGDGVSQLDVNYRLQVVATF